MILDLNLQKHVLKCIKIQGVYFELFYDGGPLVFYCVQITNEPFTNFKLRTISKQHGVEKMLLCTNVPLLIFRLTYATKKKKKNIFKICFLFLCSLATHNELIREGQDTGPIVLFDKLGRVMILSAYRNFMAHNRMYNPKSGIASFGIMGGTLELPERYQVRY